MKNVVTKNKDSLNNKFTEKEIQQFILENDIIKQNEFKKKMEQLCDEYKLDLVPQLVLSVIKRKE